MRVEKILLSPLEKKCCHGPRDRDRRKGGTRRGGAFGGWGVADKQKTCLEAEGGDGGRPLVGGGQ